MIAVRTVAVLCAALCAARLGVLAQTPAPEEASLLQRIRTHMMEVLASQPNYTCLETVRRSRRKGSASKLEPLDTLRLEVALVNGKEMFAWPGSKQFEDTDIRKFVPSGMSGTGDFALHARIVFGTNLPTFEPRGESPLEDRSTVRFDFQVKRVRSGFRVRSGEVMLPVGYHGSFYADPLSLDVRKLEIVADDIPAELKLSQVSDTMEYAPVPIGTGYFLLPAGSEQVMVDSAGEEDRNRLEFTSCRQFTGQSVLSFDAPDPAEPAASAPRQEPRQELQLPPGLVLALRLTGETDLDKAVIGDEVRAEIDKDLKVKGRIILPKGAMASGRISRVERQPGYAILGLTFSDLEFGNTHARLTLDFEQMSGILTPSIRNPRLNSPPRAHEALMLLPPGHVRLSQAILMFWRTRL